MENTMVLASSGVGANLFAFSPAHIGLIVAIAVVLAVVLAGNAVLLALFFYKRRKSKLSNPVLQERREALLKELKQLQAGVLPQKKAEEAQQETPVQPPEEGSPEDLLAVVEDLASDAERLDDIENVTDEGEEIPSNEILPVHSMSALMRERLGFVGSEYDRKQYYVRYTLGFEAKLRAASSEVKDYYTSIMDTVGQYGRLKSKRSFGRERIYAGRKTMGILVFRGKTLCLALALEPADFVDTKYRVKDMGETKRFAKTPLLLKITSARRLKYAQYLLARLATDEGLQQTSPNYKSKYRLGMRSKKDMYAAGVLKITVLGEAPELTDEDMSEVAATGRFRLQILAVRDMSALMRQNFSLVGKEYDDKKYYVRYTYGFEAKLREASDETKEYYRQLIAETGYYKKLNMTGGMRGVRFNYGRNTLAQLVLRGKTLCIALALNPDDYADTKYRGKDVHTLRRFESTPMLLRLTSQRRLGYAIELLGIIMQELGEARLDEATQVPCSIEALGRDEYYARGMLKIALAGEATE